MSRVCGRKPLDSLWHPPPLHCHCLSRPSPSLCLCLQTPWLYVQSLPLHLSATDFHPSEALCAILRAFHPFAGTSYHPEISRPLERLLAEWGGWRYWWRSWRSWHPKASWALCPSAPCRCVPKIYTRTICQMLRRGEQGLFAPKGVYPPPLSRESIGSCIVKHFAFVVK